MNVKVSHVATDSVALQIELSSGGPFLVINVRTPHPTETQYGKDAQFKRVFNARLRHVGPRGGDRGEPVSIGHTVYDIRERTP